MRSETFNLIMEVVNQANHLGSRILSSGVHFIGNIPHVAPEAYFHVVYPPMDDDQISALEHQIGRSLPEELQSFYKQSNGIKLFAYALSIDGMRHSYVRTGDDAWQPYSIITQNVQERPLDAPETLVFFGGYEYDGSSLGMSPESPVVYRFAPQSVTPLNEWSSFDDMLISEVRRLSKLFDEQGQLIDDEAPTTP